mgnify:CR=1 FL=1
MNPYVVCDICGAAFEPQLRESEGDMFFTCPHCDVIYFVMKKDTTTCSWCGRVVDNACILEFEGNYYCSKRCYDDKKERHVSNREIRE